MFIIGLDLGQTADYTALAVLERLDQEYWRTRQYSYASRYLERFDLHTSYPDIVRRVKMLVNILPLKENEVDCAEYELVVDQTGVGRPVVDLLRQASLSVTAITITGGNSFARAGQDYTVPKRDLISNLQVLLQSKRLTFAENLPMVKILINELLNYQVKITETAHDVYSGREGVHDDLVLAVALAGWYGENGAGVLEVGYSPFVDWRG